MARDWRARTSIYILHVHTSVYTLRFGYLHFMFKVHVEVKEHIGEEEEKISELLSITVGDLEN